jgi:hypothetical protein
MGARGPAWRRALSAPLLLMGLICSAQAATLRAAEGGPTEQFCLKSTRGGIVCFALKGKREFIDPETVARQQLELKMELQHYAEQARRRVDGKRPADPAR